MIVPANLVLFMGIGLGVCMGIPLGVFLGRWLDHVGHRLALRFVAWGAEIRADREALRAAAEKAGKGD